jgi:hypothetical protein
VLRAQGGDRERVEERQRAAAARVLRYARTGRERVGGVQKLSPSFSLSSSHASKNRGTEARASQLVRGPYGSTELHSAGVVVVRRRRRRSARVGRPVSDPSLNVVCTPIASTARTRLPLAQPRCGARCTSVLRKPPRPPRYTTGSAAGQRSRSRKCARNRRHYLRCAGASRLPVFTAGCAGLNSPGRAREESKRGIPRG